jgi:hypothetical protein
MRTGARIKTLVFAALGIALIMAAREPKNPAPPKSEVDRGDARATAIAVLNAYRAKDLKTLASFCDEDNRRLLEEIAAQGESHPRYKSLFQGWRWQAVSQWDGKIKEVRYWVRPSASGKKIEARAWFADLGPDEVVVVTLFLKDGKWMFDDVHSPDRSEYETGSLTPEGK